VEWFFNLMTSGTSPSEKTLLHWEIVSLYLDAADRFKQSYDDIKVS